MSLFIDSADPIQVRTAFETGVVSGVTMNPSILARDVPGVRLVDVVRTILSIASRFPLSVQLTASTEEDMVAQADAYHALGPGRIVVKVPFSHMGLLVITKIRSRSTGNGIGMPAFNVTSIMDPAQACLAAEAGASYVSIFAGRIRDAKGDPKHVIRTAREVMRSSALKPRIIVGSIRHPTDVVEALSAGADIVTVPPKILDQMFWHPQTDKANAEFADAARKSDEAEKLSLAQFKTMHGDP